MPQTGAKRIVVLHDNANPEWRWVAHHLHEFQWEFIQAPVASGGWRNKIERLRVAWNAAKQSHRADLLLTFDEGLCAALVLARIAMGKGPPLVSYYFNFDRLRGGMKQARQSFLFRKVDRFVVSSTVERTLYSVHFGIDPARFDFIHWGVKAPVASDFRVGVQDYVCAVGGNSRDYVMLMQVAAARPHMPFVVVARPANLEGLNVPANVTTLTNIPYGDAMTVVAGARAMALPLVTTETPCGHVTIVSAFYLGCPLVTTRSTGVDDYVIDSETGLVVAQGSAAEMGTALDRLWTDRPLADRLAATAKIFAETHCTEANYPAHVRRLLAG
jgi:glycosyltransferase involved in cell wall biosynthesis